MNYRFFISLLFLFYACKQSVSIDKKEVISENVVKEAVVGLVNQKKSKHSIDDFQGIWESYSLYLEHESDFKDYYENKYYKIVNGNEVLDITLISNSKSNVSIDQYYVGFLDTFDASFSTNETELLRSLQNSGSTLVRCKKGKEKYDRTNIEVSSGFNRYFEVTEVLEDGFDYEEKDKYVSFRLISSLPMEIFDTLKTISRKESLDFIQIYEVDKKSRKVKVKVDKTFFHNEMSEASKRKAFLVKDDIAYMEYIDDDWVKIYYDGKIVSGGYIKRSSIEVLK